MNTIERTVCNICDSPGTFEQAKDVARVHSNVRKFREESFTVWRCINCNSLHSLESVDLDAYYAYYPSLGRETEATPPSDEVTIQPFERPIYNNRMKSFTRQGYGNTAKILDYGCNRGAYVSHLREKGYTNVFGYDPFHPAYDDSSVLEQSFDVISLQDVVEHVDDMKELLVRLITCLKPNGLLIIATPNADELDLKDADTVANFELHQPYHRQIFSEHALVDVCSSLGLGVSDVRLRWSTDTRVPFVNGSFLANYVLKKGNVVDAVVSEPIDVKAVALSPSLLAYAFFGYYRRRRGNMEIVFRK